jgi:hypothetical protein
VGYGGQDSGQFLSSKINPTSHQRTSAGKNVVLVRQSVATLVAIRCYNTATEDEHNKIEGIREITVKVEFVLEGVN